MTRNLLAALVVSATPLVAMAQQNPAKPEDTEIWSPEPKIVTPAATLGNPPSDAIVLFNGRHLDEWVSAGTAEPARWTVHDGVVTVNKQAGDIETKRKFNNYQLHLEWQVPL